jgi:tetratricopeptide (TPR) repeat protein
VQRLARRTAEFPIPGTAARREAAVKPHPQGRSDGPADGLDDRRHPPRAALEELLGFLTAEDAELLFHVLGCPECAAEARGLLAVRPSGEPQWNELWERLEGRVQHLAELQLDQVQTARLRLVELLALGPAAREQVLAEDSGLRTVAVAEQLRRQGIQVRETSVAAARGLFLLGIEVAESLTAEDSPLAVRADLRANLNVELAEVYRRTGEPALADEAFLQAAALIDEVPALDTRARYCWMLARLRAGQKRDEEALALLARAAELYRQIRDERSAEVLDELTELGQRRAGLDPSGEG